MYTYLNQIVQCVRRQRYFVREIMVSSNSAMVTRVETIPEGYEQIMRARLNPNESVLEAYIRLDQSRYEGCPYCGNREVFSCIPAHGGCGALSCHSSDDKEHYCPGCHRVTGIARSPYLRASGSGFVEEQRLLPPAAQQNSTALTLRRPLFSQALDLTLSKKPLRRDSQQLGDEARRQELPTRFLLPAPDEEPEDDSPWSLFRKRRK